MATTICGVSPRSEATKERINQRCQADIDMHAGNQPSEQAIASENAADQINWAAHERFMKGM